MCMSACVHTWGGVEDVNVTQWKSEKGVKCHLFFFLFVFLADSFRSPQRGGYSLRAGFAE